MPRPASSGKGSARAAFAAQGGPPVDRLDVTACVVPTSEPESDGTAEWDRTTLIVVQARAGAVTGLGYTYGDLAAADIASRALVPLVRGIDAMDVASAWLTMRRAMRNAGRPGVASTAIAAVDAALWDLKARLLDVSLLDLLGAVRGAVDVYGSGGFTSATPAALSSQLAGWVEAGIPRVKMKVGRDQDADPRRVAAARRAIGPDAELFVDANGAWAAGTARAMAHRFADSGVSWFEEPVSSDDVEGLRHVRRGAPPCMEVAAGEYVYDIGDARRLLERQAVDVLQADATRCGVTGFLQVAALCEAFHVPLSAHTAPSLHAPLGCAAPCVRHIEYFHDHVRIEERLFDGAPRVRGGRLAPDRSRPGLGLTFRTADAAPFLVR
jgi:L-alanine-DL-glutamate epimerase-like enolase superfamily enzyme